MRSAEVIHAVCSATGVPMGDLMSPRRHAPIARARHLAAWLMRRRGLRLEQIGRVLGRHHTTVVSSLRRVASDPDLRADAEALATEIGW